MKGNILEQITDKTKQFEKRYSFEPKKPVKEMSMREMLGKMRNLNENIEPEVSPAEIDREKEKMLNFFANDNVDINFENFQVQPQGVFLSGLVGDQIQFSYTVTPKITTKDQGVQLNYLNGFDANNPENDKLVKKVQDYYDTFSNYWIENQLQLN